MQKDEARQIIKHRGPDGQGMINLPRATLGHTRLAIIDVEGGHQPMGMRIPGGRIQWGNIQFPRTGPGLSSLELICNPDSDTEILVHLYRKLGEQCVELLQGMFAIGDRAG